jgi:tRNA threonylcarbamoyladenosine biosynthesis protein TsaB
VKPETVLPLEAWLASLDTKTNYEFISAVPVSFASGSIIEAPKYLASAIALCAEKDMRDGLATDPALLDANYVRRSDAELFWRDR